MTYVATLISNPDAAALDDAILRRARRSLFAAQEPLWLDPGIAAEIVFAPGVDSDQRGLTDHLRTVIGADPIDVVVQRTGPRRKALFVADMDSTMIGQECIDELADFAGLKAHVAAHHRTRHARRDRVRTGTARARGPAQGLAGFGRGESDRRAHHADARRANTGANHARTGRATPASSPADSRCSPNASPT